MRLSELTFRNTVLWRLITVLVMACVGAPSVAHAQQWNTVTTINGSVPAARHESGAIVYDGMVYLFGGRGERPVDRYDPTTNVWETVANAPVEMHHFQPVIHDNKIYIIGAFSCCYPNEPTIPEIYVFDPADNSWVIAGTMPTERLRGSGGTVSYNNKIYVVGGNTRGHNGGAVPWFDEYDPATGEWKTLPDAPTNRDHFSAVIINDELIATGGRQTAKSFDTTIGITDVFDFRTGRWMSGSDIPTPRAGTNAIVYEGQAFIIGGESASQAHNTVEIYNATEDKWLAIANMINPRHAGGAAVIGTDLHVFAGSTTRGGGGESNFHEVIDLSLAERSATTSTAIDTDNDGLTDDDEQKIFFTDINLQDTDGDNLSDYQEIYTSRTDPKLADSDGDGVEDQDEIERKLDPNNPDTDGDALSDGDELTLYLTQPDNNDSDADGVMDGSEIHDYQTDPLVADSDNDSLSDGLEIYTTHSNPRIADTDNDGLSDAVEYNEHGTSLTSNDTDSDGLSDADELYVHFTNPISNDTDSDGIRDGDEILIHHSNATSMDTDGDGITDGQEIASGSSLVNTDEDNDGILNTQDGLLDADGDGIPNYADRDSDNDGIPDLVENGLTDINYDGQIDTATDREVAGLVSNYIVPAATSITVDTDGDGVPDFIDLDSDQDGIPDLAEATADYSTSNSSIITMIDANNDGLSDDYLSSSANDDTDQIPNHLDLDSDDDGIYDLAETGSADLDNNGIVDEFIDRNSDGLADFGRPTLGSALPDEDNDSIPDVVDSEYNNNRGPFGCTLSTQQTKTDPVLLILLMLSLGCLVRKRYPHSQ